MKLRYIPATLLTGIIMCASSISASVTSPARDNNTESLVAMLYDSMPLPDSIERSESYFRENVDMALRARHEMPWGKDVPEELFRYFVVPVRINNEMLDTHRRTFYEELKPRIDTLSMTDAILEINHWCHEKATYAPSDGRTHAPLATVYTATGRCGEESTFTVAALRAMCIPARQIYTPRWAHTDDNHAWVEAWADGEWHFLGACEPEAVLDLGWFNAPASRGVLMNTRVYGDYKGTEKVLKRSPGVTELNCTAKYAPTATLTATVTDPDGCPVPNALVRFGIFNYCEFYPVLESQTDSSGQASIEAGLGDMVVWATDGERFGFTSGRPGNSVEVRLLFDADTQTTVDLDIVPPAENPSLPYVSPEQAADNALRLAQEDSIRNAYIESRLVSVDLTTPLSEELGVDPEILVEVIPAARVNARPILDYLRSLPEGKDREDALLMISHLSDKDMRDIDPTIVNDFLSGDRTAFLRRGMRAGNETLTPYAGRFRATFSDDERAAFKADPMLWRQWVADNIDAGAHWLPASVIMTPAAVLESRLCDGPSRDIFFVAGARAMGIDALYDAVTSRPVIVDPLGRYISVEFESHEVKPQTDIVLRIVEDDKKRQGATPVYYTHFTLSRIIGGVPHLMEFDERSTAASISGYNIEPGQYMLTTGRRLADGTVLARSRIFTVRPSDKEVKVDLDIRRDDTRLSVIGSFNSEGIYHNVEQDTDCSLLSTTGRGYYVIAFLRPGHEPSVHALNDISAAREQLDATGLPIVILVDSQEAYDKLMSQGLPPMPANVTIGIDRDGQLATALAENLNFPTDSRPIVAVADTFNRVVFARHGYNIGIGTQIANLGLSR